MKKSVQKKHEKTLPTWMTTLSNKILPPLFFFSLAVLTLHLMPLAGTKVLKLNLGILSITSSTISFYLTILLL
ncbi:MAG: hypothetical protein QF775_03785 [archaeon]|jgi:hypothetical protein|nr:hypothetical protein [Euryarchaeota archaeon]MDP6704580.1 hypothetical protein [archaeon]